MNSFIKGSLFENTVIRCLKAMSISPLNQRTFNKSYQLQDIENKHATNSAKQMNQMYKISTCLNQFIKNPTNCSYNIINDGRNGDSTDIRLIEGSSEYNFSLKHNNLSIKHQTPSNLYRQLLLTPNQTIDYRKEYTMINNKYYYQWKDTMQFCNVTNKPEAIYEVNSLVEKYINRSSLIQQNNYINFLLSLQENKYIMKWNDTDETLSLIKWNIANSVITNSSIVENSLLLNLSNDIKIKMRLHTGSKNITRRLSLKYDTTIDKLEEFFKTEIY